MGQLESPVIQENLERKEQRDQQVTLGQLVFLDLEVSKETKGNEE